MAPSFRLLTALALAFALPPSHAQDLPKPNPPLTPLPAKRPPLVAEDMLEASLEKVRFDAKSATIRLEFVLKNRSQDRSIRLSERWNSFGSQQWRFEAKTAAGQDLVSANVLTDWPEDWPEDSPTFFTIAPGKQFRCACTLTIEDKQGGPEHLYRVRRSFESPRPRKLGFEPAWSFPLKLTGHFKAILNPIAKPVVPGSFTDWKGQIKTAEVMVTRE